MRRAVGTSRIRHHEPRIDLFRLNISDRRGHSGPRGGAHALESAVSALFDSAHGAGLSVVMPAWLEVVSSTDEKGCTRVARFAINVFGVNPDLTDLKGVPDEGIRRFRCWLADISMPASLSELDVEQSDMDTLGCACRLRWQRSGWRLSHVHKRRTG